MAILDDKATTAWSLQLQTGFSFSFLVHTMTGLTSDEQQIREANPEMLLPFICKSRQRPNGVKYDTIVPLGFDKVVKLNSHRTSYKVTEYKLNKKKVVLYFKFLEDGLLNLY